jgi:hypothetical protein
VQEEKRILGRLNWRQVSWTRKPTILAPKDDELNLQLGLVEDEGVPERELVNMESEMTRRNGTEDETTLPGDLDELGGERCCHTGVVPTQGEEKLGRLDTETSDMDPETDNTQILYNNELNPQLDSVENEEVTECDLDNMNLEMVRGTEAGEVTTPHERRNHNDETITSTKTTGEPEESEQLSHGVWINEYPDRVVLYSEDDTSMVDHLQEKPMGRWYDNVMTTANAQQHTKDPSEMIAPVPETVREKEDDELETSPELERDGKIVMSGDQGDIDPGTTGDEHTKLIDVERRRGRSNNEGQGVQSLAPPPKQIAEDIQEGNHLSKTLVLLSSPTYDQYTNIVSAFDTDITKEDFERLQTRRILNEGCINWMISGGLTR